MFLVVKVIIVKSKLLIISWLLSIFLYGGACSLGSAYVDKTKGSAKSISIIFQGSQCDGQGAMQVNNVFTLKGKNEF